MPWFRTAARCLVLTMLAAPAAAQPIRVTIATSGQPDGSHGPAALSRDGRFVVFVSDATNLVAGDTNASTDVFVRDLVAATTARVSLAGDSLERAGRSGATPATWFEDFGQREIDISGDGRFVVFTSRAPLVPGDTVHCTIAPETTPGNCADVYLRDRQTNQTIRLSEAPGGGSADGPSGHPRISSDGRWVAFDSAATNLVAGDTNGVSDVFLLDRSAGTLTRVSVSSTGGQGELGSLLPSLSDDGAVVAFASAATLLSAEPDPVVCINSPPACTRPFWWDCAAARRMAEHRVSLRGSLGCKTPASTLRCPPWPGPGPGPGPRAMAMKPWPSAMEPWPWSKRPCFFFFLLLDGSARQGRGRREGHHGAIVAEGRRGYPTRPAPGARQADARFGVAEDESEGAAETPLVSPSRSRLIAAGSTTITSGPCC